MLRGIIKDVGQLVLGVAFELGQEILADLLDKARLTLSRQVEYRQERVGIGTAVDLDTRPDRVLHGHGQTMKERDVREGRNTSCTKKSANSERSTTSSSKRLAKRCLTA